MRTGSNRMAPQEPVVLSGSADQGDRQMSVMTLEDRERLIDRVETVVEAAPEGLSPA